MAASSVSPVAPARIGALLVPVGKLKRARFDSFVERICLENVVRLGDISPDQRPDRNLFSPLAFPSGVMLYDISTFQAPESHHELFPFELHRTQLVVLGLVDGCLDTPDVHSSNTHSDSESVLTPEAMDRRQQELEAHFPHAFAVQLIAFDCAVGTIVQNALTVPPKDQSRSTTIKTVMCDVSAKLLSAMSVFAKAVQVDENILSPICAKAHTPTPYLKRHNSLRETGSIMSSDGDRLHRPSSSNKSRFDAEELQSRRASSPGDVSATTAFQLQNRPSSPPSRPSSRPPTPEHNHDGTLDLRQRPANVISRIRDGDRNRNSVHGMPSISPSERAKNITKLRQGLILGNLYLLAGRWSDALRDLVDNTTRAKVFSDTIWYAKGMENILATLILLSWARMDFTIPPICFSGQERPTSLKHVSSASLVRSSRSMDSDDGQASRTLSNLAMILPELVNSIVLHYRRDDGVDVSSVAQLPFSETVIRLSYLMAVMQRDGGQLTERTIRFLVLGTPSLPQSRYSQRSLGTVGLHNADVAGMVYQAFPVEPLVSSMPFHDIVTILSGIISVLSLAKLYRKRAMIIREAISLLIPRLIQARKVGAAELGIHPAASLAARHGLNIDSVSGAPTLGGARKDLHFRDLLAVLCETFGVPGIEPPAEQQLPSKALDATKCSSPDRARSEALLRQFGGFELKAEILRLCANFSESLPDFYGVVEFTSALLRAAGPGSAPGSESAMASIRLIKDDQLRFANKISRTLGFFKAADAAKLESHYWDPFLVRDIAINLLTNPSVYMISGHLSHANLIQQTCDHAHGAPADTHSPTTTASINAIIAGEKTEFSVTLQNLYDFSVSLERLQLVADDTVLDCRPTACSLVPRSMQQVTVIGSVTDAPNVIIRACRIKIQGCREQYFPIFSNAWKPPDDVKIKSSGLKSLHRVREPSAGLEPAGKTNVQLNEKPPEPTIKTFKIVPAQAKLIVTSSTLPQGAIDLLDGEIKAFSITMKNISKARTVNFIRVTMDYEYDKAIHERNPASTSNTFKNWIEPIAIKLERKINPVEPANSATLNFSVLGQVGLVQATLRIDYSSCSENDGDQSTGMYCRRLLIPVGCSVNRSILVGPAILLAEQQLAAFNVQNLWQFVLVITTSLGDTSQTDEVSVEPGQSTRILVPLNSFSKASSETAWHVNFSSLSTARNGRILIGLDKLAPLLISSPVAAPIVLHLQIKDARGSTIAKGVHDQYIIAHQQPLKLHAVLKNTSSNLQKAILQLQPRVSTPGGMIQDGQEVTDRLTWTGSLKRAAKLKPEEEKTFILAFSAIASGSFAIEGAVNLLNATDPSATGICTLRVQD